MSIFSCQLQQISFVLLYSNLLICIFVWEFQREQFHNDFLYFLNVPTVVVSYMAFITYTCAIKEVYSNVCVCFYYYYFHPFVLLDFDNDYILTKK